MDKGVGYTGNDSSSSSISSSSASASVTLTNNSSNSCTSNSNSDLYLKHLNKNSHKISKPVRRPLPTPDPNPDPINPGHTEVQQQSQQPPVYNINKNDFREVVQKLTGSPAHERLPNHAPPPVPPPHPRPPSSRLQRIRPPPLAQIRSAPALPPLPAVHTAAESPISAYMRLFQNQNQNASASAAAPPPASPISAYMRFLQNSYTSSISNAATTTMPSLPLSPLPFGCVPSPRSPYGMPSPNLLFSATGGQLGFPQLPLSPTPPLPSPRWK